MGLLGLYGYAVVLRWESSSALEGRYHWFGVLVAAELLLAGVGAFVLWRRRQTRWTAWWVACIVALHFIPLALLLEGWSLIWLGILQFVVLLALIPQLKASELTTSRLVGPVMGATLLLFAALSVVTFSMNVGTPWRS